MHFTDYLYLQAEARRIRNCHMDVNKGAVLKPSMRPQCSGSLHCPIQEGRSLSTKDLCIEGTLKKMNYHIVASCFRASCIQTHMEDHLESIEYNLRNLN
jgi:hypothetical protein